MTTPTATVELLLGTEHTESDVSASVDQLFWTLDLPDAHVLDVQPTGTKGMYGAELVNFSGPVELLQALVAGYTELGSADAHVVWS